MDTATLSSIMVAGVLALGTLLTQWNAHNRGIRRGYAEQRVVIEAYADYAHTLRLQLTSNGQTPAAAPEAVTRYLARRFGDSLTPEDNRA